LKWLAPPQAHHLHYMPRCIRSAGTYVRQSGLAGVSTRAPMIAYARSRRDKVITIVGIRTSTHYRYWLVGLSAFVRTQGVACYGIILSVYQEGVVGVQRREIVEFAVTLFCIAISDPR
jgi:hypothetical protein